MKVSVREVKMSDRSESAWDVVLTQGESEIRLGFVPHVSPRDAESQAWDYAYDIATLILRQTTESVVVE